AHTRPLLPTPALSFFHSSRHTPALPPFPTRRSSDLLAVANILRALSDPAVLRRSIAQLGSGLGLGVGLTLAAEKAGVALLGAISFSASTFGAGMIVGARIGVPAIVVGLIGLALTPWLRE